MGKSLKAPRAPAANMVARADAVAAAFDYDPEKPLSIPAGACRNYGQELPADFVCPVTCPCVHECYETYTRANQ